MHSENLQSSRLEYKWESQINLLPRLTQDEEEKYFRIAFRGELHSPHTRIPWPHNFSNLWPNIEITGLPNLGKTTALSEVDILLSWLGIQHHYISEETEQLPKSWHNFTAQNSFLLNSSLRQLINLQFNESKKGPILVERGPYNYLAFAETECEMTERRHSNLEFAQHFVEAEFGGLVDGLIILNANTEHSQYKRSQKLDSIRLFCLSLVLNDFPNTIARVRSEEYFNSPLVICSINLENPRDLNSAQLLRILGSMYRILWK